MENRNDNVESLETQKENVKGHKQEDFQFGWSTFRPRPAQMLNHPIVFLIFIVLLSGPQVMLSEMLPVVMRTLKVRYKLQTKDENALIVLRSFAAIVSVIVTGYLGSFRNKIRWIAAGMVLTGLGGIIFAMPHFAIQTYKPTDLPPFLLRSFGLCMFSAFPCSTETVGKSYMALFVIGQILIGAGLGPLFTLVPAYIDENVSPRSMPVYIMIWYCSLLLGPVNGMIGAGSTLLLYVDLKQPDLKLKMTNKDMRWIGAWWLGYLIFGVLTVVHSILILGFPRHLPGSRAMRIKNIQEGNIPKNDPRIKRQPSGILYATTSLLKNKVYIFNTLAYCCIAFYVSAFGPFLLRILIIKYGADPLKVSASFSAVLFVGSIVGFCLGGFLTMRIGLKTILKGAAFVCLVTEAVCIFTPLLFVIPGCNDSNIAGVSVDYPPLGKIAMMKQKGTSELTTACNARCNCSTFLSTPICGSNNVAYFDPCHAGCLARVTEEYFTNCTCIPPTIPGYIGGYAKLGFCDRRCNSYIFFLLTGFFVLVMLGANVVPSKAVVLRCVPHNQRSYALAVQSFLFILVALVPGHLIKYIMDKDCNIWQTDPCGRKGICWDYKADSMSKSMTIFGMLLTALSTVFYFLSWYFCESLLTKNNNRLLSDMTEADNILDDGKETNL